MTRPCLSFYPFLNFDFNMMSQVKLPFVTQGKNLIEISELHAFGSTLDALPGREQDVRW